MPEVLANDPTDAGPTLTAAISTTPAAGTSESWAVTDTGVRSVTDGTTATNTTVTSATAAFTAADYNAEISGGSIPAGARITAIGSGTSVTISAAATATASGLTLTIKRGPLPQSFPYTARIDDSAATPDTTVELVLVTAHTSATAMTVTRGHQGTKTKAHASGGKVRHVFTAEALQPPLSAVTTATESTNVSSAALQDHPTLKLTLAPNRVYRFQAFLVMDGPAAADLKGGFSIPSGWTIAWMDTHFGTAASGPSGSTSSQAGSVSDDSGAWGLNGAGNPMTAMVNGTVKTGPNGGLLQFRFAQVTTNATAVSTLAGCYLRAEPLT